MQDFPLQLHHGFLFKSRVSRALWRQRVDTQPCRIVSKHFLFLSHGGSNSWRCNVAWLSSIVGAASRTLFTITKRKRGGGGQGSVTLSMRCTLTRLRERKYFFLVKRLPPSPDDKYRVAYRLRKQHARHEHKCRHTRAPVQGHFSRTTQAGKTSFCERFWFSREKGPRVDATSDDGDHLFWQWG